MDKKLLNEQIRFQAIAGLRPVGSLNSAYHLNEDDTDPNSDYEDADDSLGQPPISEASWMEWWNMLHPAAIIAGSAAGALGLLKKSAKKEIVKQLQAQGEEIPDDKTLEQLANEAIKGALDKTTGANESLDA